MTVARCAHIIPATLLLLACDREGAPGAPASTVPKAATVAHAVAEASLTTVTLSEDAERRLALRLDTAARRTIIPTRTLPGEVIPAPGMSQLLSAPFAARVVRPDAGTLPPSGARVRAGQVILTLLPIAADRDVVRSTEELEVATARLTRAQLEADRVALLWRDRLVSAREREVTETELAIAQAARGAAAGRARMASGEAGVPAGVSSLVIRAPLSGVVRTLHVGDGQVVAAGAPLVDVVRLDEVWVRVAAYVGDVARLDLRARVDVRTLGETGTVSGNVATPVPAPPNADAASASADLMYALANVGGAFRPGERVQVTIPLRGAGSDRLSVPWGAVVFDHEGGSWVYERVAPRTFTRRRVVLGEVSGGWAEVHRGIAAGALVVTDGAAELLGTEFGAGK